MKNIMRIIIAVFVILHGLVHFWFVVLAQRLVPFKEEMGWTGESWLVPGSKILPTLFFSISAMMFVAAGICFILDLDIWKSLLLFSSVISSITLILFWDGSFDMIVQKGIIGLVINILIMFMVLK